MSVSALKHLFTPQLSNKNRSKVLHWEVISIFIFIVIVGNKYLFRNEAKILGFASQISTQEVIRLTNLKRAQFGLSEVTENELLDKAAKQKGLDMLSKGYWAHVAPDGTQPWDFFKKVNYRYKYAGENLARDFSSAESAVDAWMASTSHRENMLSPKYKNIGVAVVDGTLSGSDATIIVQLFGTLASDRPLLPLAAAKEVQSVASEEAVNKPTTVASVMESTTPNINQSNLFVLTPTKFLSIVIISFLLIAMMIDAFYVWYTGSVRNTSKSFPQIAFMVMILTIIIIAKVGQII